VTSRAPRGAAALLLLVLPASIAVIGLDARARRRAREQDLPAVLAVTRLLPSNGLALCGGARWLRFPALEEPGAAFQDGIALPDPDPAGGAMSPPVAVWQEIARRGARAGGPGDAR
jgi:hypothetical protein